MVQLNWKMTSKKKHGRYTHSDTYRSFAELGGVINIFTTDNNNEMTCQHYKILYYITMHLNGRKHLKKFPISLSFGFPRSKRTYRYKTQYDIFKLFVFYVYI